MEYDETMHRDYEEIGELKEKNEILIEAEDDLNEQDIEEKIRNFEEEIREYEGGMI